MREEVDLLTANLFVNVLWFRVFYYSKDQAQPRDGSLIHCTFTILSLRLLRNKICFVLIYDKGMTLSRKSDSTCQVKLPVNKFNINSGSHNDTILLLGLFSVHQYSINSPSSAGPKIMIPADTLETWHRIVQRNQFLSTLVVSPTREEYLLQSLTAANKNKSNPKQTIGKRQMKQWLHDVVK